MPNYEPRKGVTGQKCNEDTATQSSDGQAGLEGRDTIQSVDSFLGEHLDDAHRERAQRDGVCRYIIEIPHSQDVAQMRQDLLFAAARKSEALT